MRKLCVFIAFLSLIVGTAFAQDVRSVLQTAAKAMGATNLKTIQYSGTGWDSSVGQSYNLTSDWPRFEVPSFMRTIDYDAKSLREERTRRWAAGGAVLAIAIAVIVLFGGVRNRSPQRA